MVKVTSQYNILIEKVGKFEICYILYLYIKTILLVTNRVMNLDTMQRLDPMSQITKLKNEYLITYILSNRNRHYRPPKHNSTILCKYHRLL